MGFSSETRPKSWLHGVVAAHAGSRLGQYVEEHGLGTAYMLTGFDLGEISSTIAAPDISFVHRDRLPVDDEDDGYFPGAPDLAMEVVDSADTIEMVDGLRRDLIAAGCRMVIIIDPMQRTAGVFRPDQQHRVLTENDVLDGGDVVPGWKLVLREVFT
jgi:Uma2 family endonuclease